MIFTCVGFDVREYPCKEGFSADRTEWERDEARYAKVTMDWGLVENEYRLLNIDVPETLASIQQYVSGLDSCDLVAIELPLDVVKFYDSKWGYTTASSKVDLTGFVCHGFDICDTDGLLTILNHPVIKPFRGVNGLIPKSQMMDALEIAQLANVVESSHRPCVVTKVYSLKAPQK